MNTVGVEVSDALEVLHTASASAIYEVLETQGDISPPTPPTGLSARLKGKNVNLSWNASTDNVGVSGYVIWRDGVAIGDVTDTSYLDNTVSAGGT
jgi:hypothetical protein